MKWILYILAGIVIVFIAIIIITPMVFPLERYKPRIEAQVTQYTGRPFTLGGEIKLSLLPWIGVELTDLHLGNLPEFKEKDFISIGTFEARIKLLPLLSRNLEIKRFIINQPVIVLAKTENGWGNWLDLGPAKKETKGPTTPAPLQPKPESNSPQY